MVNSLNNQNSLPDASNNPSFKVQEPSLSLSGKKGQQTPLGQDFPAEQTTTSSFIEKPQPKKQKMNLAKALIGFVIISFLAVIVVGLAPKLGEFKKIFSQKGEVLVQEPADAPKIKGEGVILKVGEEKIFRSDYDTEFNAYPAVEDKESLKDKLEEKLISDSIILQAGQKERIVSLDESVFNSQDKDYKKRVEMVGKIKKSIGEKGIALKGSKVAVWVVNVEVGPLGYERSRQIAWAKIKPLYEAVKAREMTMKEAGNEIINDKSLAQVDSGWKGNAYTEFEKKRGARITSDKEFDGMIWSLEAGEVTSLYTYKNTFGAEAVDIMYTFAQVDEKKTDSETVSFADWFSKNKEAYEIVYY